jgi:phospholipid transport system transporter-binding protein
MIEGALSFQTVPGLLTAKGDALAKAGTLDLAAVTHVDSAGIALLLELRRRAAGQLTLTGAPPQMRALADFLGVSPLLGLEPSHA